MPQWRSRSMSELNELTVGGSAPPAATATTPLARAKKDAAAKQTARRTRFMRRTVPHGDMLRAFLVDLGDRGARARASTVSTIEDAMRRLLATAGSVVVWIRGLASAQSLASAVVGLTILSCGGGNAGLRNGRPLPPYA